MALFSPRMAPLLIGPRLTEIAELLAGRGVDLGDGGLCSWFGSVGDGRSRLLVGAEIGCV